MISYAGEDVEIGKHSSMLVGMQTCAATVESVWQFLRKLGVNLPQDPAIPLLGIFPRDALSYCKSICSTMFLAALFVIARTWTQPRCPSIEEWLKKVWNIYTLEFYSVVKNNDILNFACKWMDIENALLSEVTQTQKEEYGMYSLISGFLVIVKGL